MIDHSTELKKNVSVFESDTAANSGYVYTTNAKYSSTVANRRQSEAIHDAVKFFCSRSSGMKTLLDIGSGDGTYTAELKTEFPDLQITGFDPAAKAVNLAKSKYPAVSFSTGNILDKASLPTQVFDIAVFRGVLHHVESPALAILNSTVVAQHLVILEPNGWNPILKFIEKTSKYHIEHEERSFAPSLLETWCGQAKYRVLKRVFIGYVPFFFPTLPAKLLYFFQPLLEKIPGLKHIFAGCVVLYCEKE